MLALDLQSEAESLALPYGELPQLSAPEHALATSTWRGRMENEHASSLVFAGLLHQAVEAGASAKLQAELAQMILEEQGHARLCAGVLHALGGKAQGAIPEPKPLPRHEDTTRRSAFLRNVMSVCCLSETVAVALIDAERLSLEGTMPGRVLKTILADEVGHARLGWKILEDWALSTEEKADLSRYLGPALEHLERHELAHLSPLAAPTEACAAAGVCDGALAREIFQATVETVILPRLAAHGVRA